MRDDSFEDSYNYNGDVIKVIDDVKPDFYGFTYVRGDDNKTVTYNASTHYDATYSRVIEIFKEFISEVYGYEIDVTYNKASPKRVKLDEEATRCEGCNNLSCFLAKGCE